MRTLALVLVAAAGSLVAIPASARTSPVQVERQRCRQALWTFSRDYDTGKSLLYRLAWRQAFQSARELAEDVVFAMRTPAVAARPQTLRCCEQIHKAQYGGFTSPFVCLKQAIATRAASPVVAR
jgi:hypothetical protein